MSSPKVKLALGAILLSTPTVLFSEVCGPDEETNENPTPWKTRLYGANKDRRAARKKRAKKLGRRR